VFLSQRPYMPNGSLREVLSPSEQEPPLGDDAMRAVLERVGLDQLGNSLDRVERWDNELTGDEQERLVLARVLLRRPRWIVSDEAINLADESTRACVLSLFANELAHTGLISISSQGTTNGFYSRAVDLVADPGARLRQSHGLSLRD
jgi:putative ATP-binding cassette transporter